MAPRGARRPDADAWLAELAEPLWIGRHGGRGAAVLVARATFAAPDLLAPAGAPAATAADARDWLLLQDASAAGDAFARQLAQALAAPGDNARSGWCCTPANRRAHPRAASPPMTRRRWRSAWRSRCMRSSTWRG